MSFYSDMSATQLFDKLRSLANEHQDDDELYNDTGNVDYTLTHMRMIIDELQSRVDEQLLDDTDVEE
jgi:hypothetical protein